MPRPTSPRNVGYVPEKLYFKPAGVSISELDVVVIRHDELEAIRLKNILRLSQEEAAAAMNVSQPTFHRLISAAHEKVADAIVNGKALRIEGGNIAISRDTLPECGVGWKGGSENNTHNCVLEQVRQSGELVSASRGNCRTKIAISSVDGTPGGLVDERFGRARKFVIYDLEADSYTVFENLSQVNQPHGAGVRTAQIVADLGAGVVISGHFGPQAFNLLQAAGMKAYSAPGITVAEAVREYREGRLPGLNGADVDGHW